MRQYLKAAGQGFMRGFAEAPRGFFAPVTGLVRCLVETTDRETGHRQQSQDRAGHEARSH